MAKSTFWFAKADKRCKGGVRFFQSKDKAHTQELKANGTPLYIRFANGSLFCIANNEYEVLKELGLRKGYKAQAVELAA